MGRWDHDDHNEDVWSSRCICCGQDGETALNPRVNRHKYDRNNICSGWIRSNTLTPVTRSASGKIYSLKKQQMWDYSLHTCSEGAVVLGLMTAGSPSLMTVHQQRLLSGSCGSDLLHLSMSTMQTGRPASTDACTHAHTHAPG